MAWRLGVSTGEISKTMTGDSIQFTDLIQSLGPSSCIFLWKKDRGRMDRVEVNLFQIYTAILVYYWSIQ